MNKIIKQISVELYGTTKYYEVSAKQGDKATRFISIKILDEKMKQYVIPTDAMIIANVKKPDGNCCFNECVLKDNTIIMELTNQMLACTGTVLCDIEIRTFDSNEILSTASFAIEVEESMRNEQAIMSSNEMTALDQCLNRLDVAEKDRELAEIQRNNKLNEMCQSVIELELEANTQQEIAVRLQKEAEKQQEKALENQKEVTGLVNDVEGKIARGELRGNTGLTVPIGMWFTLGVKLDGHLYARTIASQPRPPIFIDSNGRLKLRMKEVS